MNGDRIISQIDGWKSRWIVDGWVGIMMHGVTDGWEDNTKRRTIVIPASVYPAVYSTYTHAHYL